jgi:hypothetical protein
MPFMKRESINWKCGHLINFVGVTLCSSPSQNPGYVPVCYMLVCVNTLLMKRYFVREIMQDKLTDFQML